MTKTARIARVTTLVAATLAMLVTGQLSAAADQPFTDVDGSFAEDAVAQLADRGVLNGCDNNRFCPNRPLTRAQFASMLARLLDDDLDDAPAASPFTDVDADATHGRAIAKLTANGLIAGCDDGLFCPAEPLTRAQAMTLLDRTVVFPPAGAGEYFTDIDGTHQGAIERAASAGVTAGCEPARFCPSDTVTRAQAAVLFARALGLSDPVSLDPFNARVAAQEELGAERERRRQIEEARAAERERQRRLEDRGARVVDAAMNQLGTPYGWGGNGPDRFDCSGLTSFAWRSVGVDIPRTSRQQHAALEPVSRDELIPGDLVFYHSPVSHVAIYIGDGEVVEAPNSGGVVRVRTDGLSRSGLVGFGRPAS